MQAGMLFHYVSSPRPGADFQQLLCTSKEHFDPGKFMRAWHETISRHAILRTSIHWEDRETPMQRVHDDVELPVALHDWRGLSEHEFNDKRTAFMMKDRKRGFDLTNAPLMRLALLQRSDETYDVLWSFHHILLDGRSFYLVLSEVYKTYDGLCGDKPYDAPTHVPFERYIRWFEQLDHQESETYFRSFFQGFEGAAAIQLARSEPEVLDEAQTSGRKYASLNGDVSARLRSAAESFGVTTNTFVQAAWALVLARYSGKSDVVFGGTRACRHGGVPDAASIVGLLINTLPVRAQFDNETRITDLLRDLRQQWLALRRHEHTPLSKIREWAGIRVGHSLFDTILVVENFEWRDMLRKEGPMFSNREFSIHEWSNHTVTFSVDIGPTIELTFEHDRRKLDDDSAERILGYFRSVLLELIALDPTSDKRVVEVGTLSEKEKAIIAASEGRLHKWFGIPNTIHGLFERAAERYATAIAVQDASENLSYALLDRRANALAQELTARGVGRETPVVLCVDRTVDRAVAILGILKAGGAYVALDPDYPEQRLRWMLDDCGAKHVVASGHGERVLREATRATHRAFFRPTASECANGPTIGSCGEDLAYAIYTSGSTGTPKGAMVEHHSVVNHALAMAEILGLHHKDRVPHSASLCFDLSVLELFATWSVGGCLVMRPAGVLSSDRLGPWLHDERISVLHLPTALWHQWITDLDETVASFPPNLRVIVAAGEQVSSAVCEKFQRMSRGRIHWVNIYGPTETTVNVTTYSPPLGQPLPAADRVRIPVGKAIANCSFEILDAYGRPTPPGVSGELFLGGECIGRGYLNRPELTRERFVCGTYKTGDMARLRSDGNLEILGRIDNQVKVRGFRVELGEIEAAMETHPRIERALATTRPSGTAQRIDAYYVPKEPNQVPSATDVRRHLQKRLPDFMVPSTLTSLPCLPVTPNGKVDRAALPNPAVEEAAWEAPRNAVEEILARIWAEELRLPRVGIRDDFFALGGDSLTTLRILSRASHAGLTFDPADLFRYTTVAEMAGIVTTQWAPSVQPASAPRLLVTMRRSGTKSPLFFLHSTPGDLLGLSQLVYELGSEHPCYGFQSLALTDPTRAHRTIPEMARAYVEEMLAMQPEGPYHLAGWCYGGIVAFEMAHELLRRDKEVGMVAIIEAVAPRPGFGVIGYYMDMVRSFLMLTSDIRELYDRIRFSTANDPIRSEKNIAEQLGVEVGLGPLANRRESSLANLAAYQTYRPRPLPAAIQVFRARERMPGTCFDANLRWSRLAHVVETIEVSGSHESVLRAPHVSTLATKLRDVFTRWSGGSKRTAK